MSIYDVPKVGEDEQRVAVPQEEIKLNERLAALEDKILAYYQAAGFQLLGTQYVHSALSPEVNARLAKNQELKDHVRLLYTELEDTKERASFADRKSLIDSLEQDLADFEANFVVEIEEAA